MSTKSAENWAGRFRGSDASAVETELDYLRKILKPDFKRILKLASNRFETDSLRLLGPDNLPSDPASLQRGPAWKYGALEPDNYDLFYARLHRSLRGYLKTVFPYVMNDITKLIDAKILLEPPYNYIDLSALGLIRHTSGPAIQDSAIQVVSNIVDETIYNLDELKKLFSYYRFSDGEEMVDAGRKVCLTYKDQLPSEQPAPNTGPPFRRPIRAEVRREVWRRDQRQCVECGSKERLEFDHIIPLSKGGSDTVRNIQLLCERCNRSKSDKI